MESVPGKERVSQSERLVAKVQVFTFCNNLRSQKVILSSIESEINSESVSEKILDSLEKLEKLYRELEIPIPGSMISSYEAVALACSFRGLPESCVDNVFDRRIPELEMINSKFVTKYMRLGRDCIRVLESNPGKLYKWKEEGMNTKYKEVALMVVKCYLREAMTPIEPALKDAKAKLERLEAREKRAISKETETNPVLEDKGIGDCKVGGGECQSSQVHGPKTREIQGEMLPRRKSVNPRRYRGPARIADSDDSDSEKMGASQLKQATVSDPLINELIQSKKMGISEAKQPLVGDPMVDELIQSTKMGTSEAMQMVEPLTDESIQSKKMGTSEAKRPFVGDPLIDSKSPNATVCSSLIDESILVSPKRKVISPLKIYKKKKLRQMWSPEEEDALREGVREFGAGKWKRILNSNRDCFVGRNEVDLKDKWRNLMK